MVRFTRDMPQDVQRRPADERTELLVPESEADQELATGVGHRTEAYAPRRAQRWDTGPDAGAAAPHQPAALSVWRDRVVVGTLQLLFRYRFMCIGLVMCAGLSGAVATKFMTPFFVARASIFPPAASNPLGQLGLPGVFGLVGNMNLGGDGASLFPLYERFLFSRSLILELLQVSLAEAGHPGTLLDYLAIEEPDRVLRDEIAVGTVRMGLSFETDNKTVVVTVGYQDADPKVAAVVANRAVELLDHFDTTTTANRAAQRRRFIDARLQTAAADLGKAEKQLEEFQESNMRIDNAPELLMDRARLQREVEIEQQVYLTLRKEYELVLIEEQRDVAVVNVLDKATPPLLPEGPSVVRNAAVAGLAASSLLVAWFVLLTMGAGRYLLRFLPVRSQRSTP